METDAMEILRTPDARFEGLPGYAFAPHYVEVGGLRMHYVDEGPRDGALVLLLHGEPSWSYLYRKLIPILVAAGLRAVAPDLVGFGRSDKPGERAAYSYQSHMDWLKGFVAATSLRDITLVCQDWGGLLGLRCVGEAPGLFARVVAANTFLPTGDAAPSAAFLAWRKFSQETPRFHVGGIVKGGCATPLSPEVIAAYKSQGQNLEDFPALNRWFGQCRVRPGFEKGRKAGEELRTTALTADSKGHELWATLDVRPDDLIVEKDRFSAFIQGSSNLADVLRDRGVDTILVTGTVTTCRTPLGCGQKAVAGRPSPALVGTAPSGRLAGRDGAVTVARRSPARPVTTTRSAPACIR
jgi:pimeloyl-ACP methyl ester carboxylesterase